MQLDKEDIQRCNLNSKYLSATLVLEYPDSFMFLLFSIRSRNCKVRFDFEVRSPSKRSKSV